MTTRTRLPADQRRAQLLDAAKGIVAEQGFHAVSIEAVARAAGITRPIVYHHFPGGLDDVLVSLLDRETGRALDQLAGMLQGEGPLNAFAAYLDAVEADPVTWGLVLVAPEGMPAVLREEIRTWRSRFAGAIGAGVDAPDPELTGRMLQTMADEGCRLLLTGDVTKQRLLDQASWLLGRLSG